VDKSHDNKDICHSIGVSFIRGGQKNPYACVIEHKAHRKSCHDSAEFPFTAFGVMKEGNDGVSKEI
jgi:hypothetical protein